MLSVRPRNECRHILLLLSWSSLARSQRYMSHRGVQFVRRATTCHHVVGSIVSPCKRRPWVQAVESVADTAYATVKSEWHFIMHICGRSLVTMLSLRLRFVLRCTMAFRVAVRPRLIAMEDLLVVFWDGNLDVGMCSLRSNLFRCILALCQCRPSLTTEIT